MIAKVNRKKRKQGKPAVSVVTPAYNASAFIATCMKSVLSQNADYEMIVVNDGSTDNTEQIVRSFRDDRIRCFSQSNSGPAGARNFGIRNSRADYTVFVDADDILAPGGIKAKHGFLEKNDELSLVLANQYRFTETGVFTLSTVLDYWKALDPFELIVCLCCMIYVWPDNQPMWRSSAIKSLKGFKNIYTEDAEILLAALLQGMKVGFIQKFTSYRRMDSEGLTSRGNVSTVSRYEAGGSQVCMAT